MNSGNDIGAGGRVPLYEVAKDLKLQAKDMVVKARALGIDVKNHMSKVDVTDVERIKRALDKERQANLVEERLTSTVIRRRSRDGSPVRAEKPAAAPAASVEAKAPVADRPAAPANEQPSAPVETKPEKPVRRVVEVAPPKPEVEAKEERPPIVEKPVVRHVPVETKAPSMEKPAAPSTPASTEKPAAPAAEKPAAPPAAAKPEAPAAKEEPRLGPTGRVIELPLPLIEIRQADPRERFQRTDVRQPTPGMRHDGPGMRQSRDRFAQQKKKAQPGKKQKQTQITTPAAHKRVIKMEETVAVGEIAK